MNNTEKLKDLISKTGANIPSNNEDTTSNDYLKYTSAQTNKNSATSVQNNLNSVVTNLSKEYNTITDMINEQRNIINKEGVYIDNQNRSLDGQLKELNRIESIITTRTKLIEENEMKDRRSKRNINIISFFFLYLLFTVFPLIAYINGSITLYVFLLIFITMTILYVIYALWKTNSFKIKKMTKKFVDKTKAVFDKLGDDIYQDGNDFMNAFKNKKKIDARCVCPPGSESEEPDYPPEVTAEFDNVVRGNKGFYYDDGSSPTERIYPMVDKHNSGKWKERIDWETDKNYGYSTTAKNMPEPNWRWDKNANLDLGKMGGLPKFPDYKNITPGSCDRGKVKDNYGANIVEKEPKYLGNDVTWTDGL